MKLLLLLCLIVTSLLASEPDEQALKLFDTYTPNIEKDGNTLV